MRRGGHPGTRLRPPSVGACSARPQACRVATRGAACVFECARPSVSLSRRNQTCPHRIVLYIPRDSHPVVVRFFLPERYAGSAQHTIGLSRCIAFERLHQLAHLDFGKQQGMDMIRHDDESCQFVVAEFHSLMQGAQGSGDQARNCILPQEHRTRTCRV